MAGESHASVKSYMIGFVLSVILTAIPFGLVMNTSHYGFSLETVLAAILALAVVQVVRARRATSCTWIARPNSAGTSWRSSFTLLILVIVVAGSIWIMHNATTNMEHHMAPTSSEGVIPQK